MKHFQGNLNLNPDNLNCHRARIVSEGNWISKTQYFWQEKGQQRREKTNATLIDMHVWWELARIEQRYGQILLFLLECNDLCNWPLSWLHKTAAHQQAKSGQVRTRVMTFEHDSHLGYRHRDPVAHARLSIEPTKKNLTHTHTHTHPHTHTHTHTHTQKKQKNAETTLLFVPVPSIGLVSEIAQRLERRTRD